MAMPSLGKCSVLVLVLAAGLIYASYAFRIRDHTPATSEVCQSATGRCTSTSSSSSPLSSPTSSSSSASPLRAKRTFEMVSMRGSFAKSKQRPPDEVNTEVDADLKKKDKKITARPWSKLTKIEEDVSGDEDEDSFSADKQDDDESKIDSDDEIIQIEVEDDEDTIVEDEEEEERLQERIKQEELQRKKKEEEKKRLAREEEEKRREREEQEKRKREEEKKKREKELEEKRRKEEEERRLKEEIERKLKEEAERRLKQEEERRLREEEEKRRLKEEEERRLKKEQEKRQREERERRLKEQEERRLKEEEEKRRLKEEEEKRLREEEERRLKAEEERRLKEEEERRLKEEEERRLKEEEERRLKEEEERRLREEEEQRLQEEEECRIQEEEELRKKEEEERIKREEEEKEAEIRRKEEEKRRKKELQEEEERKRKEMEEKEAERLRDLEKDRLRVERLKREAEEKKIREEEQKRKKRKTISDEDENGDNGNSEDDEDVSFKSQKKLEKIRLAEKEKAKSVESPRVKSSVKDVKDTGITKKATVTKSEESKSKTKKENGKKTASNESKATKPKKGSEASLSLAELNDMILSVPTFMLNFTAVEDPVCQQHGKIFLRQLRGYKLWALQMLDSSAKIPSGLLRGNVNQLGDFDQCLGITTRVKIEEKTVKIQGKYCLASMDLYPTHPATKMPVNLMQSRALIRGNMRDPGHFIPKFTTANWALCLPAACSAEDARKSIEDALESYNMTIGVRFVLDVDPEMCYVKQKSQSYSKETIGVLYFYAIFICLAIVATLRDYFATLKEKGNYSERIIMAFSLKRTLKALFGNKETSPSDIGCIHGIRSLSTIALYVAHKLIPTSRMPYANRVSLTEIASTPLSTLLRASLFYTDSFLLLSGVLTAYNMAKELQNRGEIRWFCRFIARFVRLTPSLLAVVFWYAFVMEHTGSGPQWNAVVKANADICKENAWINLLYVQNFFPFEEMCATHTHQLALDMQLSLIAPTIVFFLQIKPIVGIIIVFFLLQVSATLRYLATINNNLSLVIFHGMTIKHLYKTANLTYALPLHRATPYLFGVSLGVILHYTGKNVRIHKVFIILGWLIALVLGSWSLFSPWRLARRDYTYDVEEATQYAVISPIMTALSLSWTIFACFTNNGGFINRILSSYWLVIFSRLSYAIYLSQFAVFFYNIGTARYSSEFQTYKIIDLYEVISVTSVSIVLTLLFDIPMHEVKNIIMEMSDTLSVEGEKSKESLVSEEDQDNEKLNSSEITPEEEEEPTPGGWNWNRGKFTKSEPHEYEENGVDENFRSSRIKRQDIRRQTMIRSEAYDEWDNRSRRITRSEEHSMDDNRSNRDELTDNYLHSRERYFPGGYTRSPMRDLNAPIYRRSASRERLVTKELETPARDYSKKPLITISKEEDYQISRSPRSSISRFQDQRSLSSESESDILSRRGSGNFNRRPSAEPRISDEDDWEEDLRIRRGRFFQERVSSQERDRVPPPVVEEEDDEEWDSLKRRSSAEGKMALLKEPIRPGNMELWTVSKIQLGSSQEPDDEEYDEELYLQQRREYREQRPPLREEFEEEETAEQPKTFESESLPTSFEEEDDVSSHDFVLKKDSKRITVQDLSKLPADDELLSADMNWNKLDVKSSSSGLFKRESIVKSQASEEDPEYLLPERPKLVEQEQEHPFKKAWQLQKSRSEEDGSAAFIVKESKPSTTTSILEKQKEESEEKSEEDTKHEGGQSEEITTPDVTCDVTIVWQSRSNETDEVKSSSKSEASSSSSKFDWPDDEEQFENHKNRRKSDEENWTWTERDT